MIREQISYRAASDITVAPQVRESIDGEGSKESIKGLALSIRENGLLFPLRVRTEGAQTVLVDGARRLAAVKLLGWNEVPVIVEAQPLGEAAIVQKQLVANCQRLDLLPLEKARAIQKLIEVTGLTGGQVGAKLGYSAAQVTRLLAVLSLPTPIQSRVQAGEISVSGAYELSRVADPQRQAELAEDLANGRVTRDGLSGAAKAGRGLAAKPRTASTPTRRVTAALSAGRSITVTGADSLERLIEVVEELLAKARKARPQGLALGTFIKLLKDQAAV